LFVLADQHRRRELNDLAGRLDSQPISVDLCEGLGPTPPSSVPGLSPDGYRMFPAIGELPEDEREDFDLARIQEMSHAEAAHVLGVSVVTVQRRLNRGLRLLPEQLADLSPGEGPPGSI
jgi:RNA polymerase sigma-70 factor (ECF subfamily)